MKKKKPVLLGKIALFVGLPILLVFGLLRMWINTLRALPIVTIPSHAMPAVNARDYFITASNQQQSKSEDDLALTKQYGNKKQFDYPYPASKKAKIVSANALCLATLRQGLAYPYMEPPVRSFSTLLPYYPKFRALARLLRLEADTRASKGDYAGAVDSCLDAIQMGEMVPRGGIVFGALVGDSIIGIGGQNSSRCIAHLSAQQARDAAKRLEQIRTRHVSYSNALTEDKYAGQAALLELFGKPDVRKSLRESADSYIISGSSIDDGSEQNPRSRIQSLLVDLRFRFIDQSASFASYTKYMDYLVATAKQPYNPGAPRIPIPNDIVCQIICPESALAGDKNRQALANTARLELRFAIRAYVLEHGHRPDTLTQLVPAYLTQLPDDPHAAKGSFGYSRSKVGYTLFSTSGYVPPTPKKQN